MPTIAVAWPICACSSPGHGADTAANSMGATSTLTSSDGNSTEGSGQSDATETATGMASDGHGGNDESTASATTETGTGSDDTHTATSTETEGTSTTTVTTSETGTSGTATTEGSDAGSTNGSTTATDGGTDDGGDDCAVGVFDPTDPPTVLTLSGNLGTHDPVLIAAEGVYHLFHTGPGVLGKRSSDLMEWQGTGSVFDENPAWIAQQVPGATDLWAPDISHFGGAFHLYYSASTFGSNESCIGHATSESLDDSDWTDHGSVVCSNANGANDNWNAIDPNVVVVDETAWLSFGSFWSGIKMIELDASGARANDDLHALASRPDAGGSLEAPFIVERCGWFYLFVSFDSCCRGVDSTYRMMVGRSTDVVGPYADREGQPMLEGGGTLIVQGTDRWRGPGHNAILFDGVSAYNVYHAYDAANDGNPTLRVSQMAWDADGWPVSAGP